MIRIPKDSPETCKQDKNAVKRHDLCSLENSRAAHRASTIPRVDGRIYLHHDQAHRAHVNARNDPACDLLAIVAWVEQSPGPVPELPLWEVVTGRLKALTS